MFKKKVLLLVEDDEEAIKLIKNILKKTDVTIYVSKTGEDAVDIIKTKNIDIALMDYKLPYKNGILITKEIKDYCRENNKNIPIILETVEKMLSENVDIVKEFQFDDVISKPYDREKFIETLKKYIPLTTNTTKKAWFAGLLLFLMILSGGSLYFQKNYVFSNQKLFIEYYTSENMVDVSRGSNSDSTILKFQHKNYREALKEFNEIYNRDTNNIAVLFYSGLSSIELEQYNEAIDSFKKIIRHGDSPYNEYAQWYLALCYLQKDEIEKAKKEFSSIISNPDAFNREKSQEVLKKLK